MEKGAGDDSTRGVGICDRFLTFLAKNLSMNRFLTFLAKNLSMNRQKNITEGPRNGSSNISNNHAEEQKEEEEEDEFAIQIEKVEFEFSEEEDHKSVTATILEERNTDVSTARASDQQKEEAADHQVDAEATAALVQEKKVRKSVTIKDDREEAGDKDAAAAAAKKSLFKKRRASSSDQLGAEGEDPKLPRRSLRLRMPAILRVPSNIDEQSATFIDERKRGFGRRKSEK